MAQKTILTTHSKRSNVLWQERTVLLSGWADTVEKDVARTGRECGYWEALYWGCKLFHESKHYEAVVTGSERPAHVFAFLQRLFRRKKRVVHVFVDFPWNPPARGLGRILKRVRWRIEIGAVDRIIVLGGPEQEDMFSDRLSVPRRKFQFVPYHHTVDESVSSAGNGNYIFSGGDYTRDYASLVRAVDGLPYRLIIAARHKYYFDGITIPKNVDILTPGPKGFDELLAGAKLVVLPMLPGLAHSGGQTVLLNALALGKPIILAEEGSLRNYLTPGVEALMIAPGNPVLLRDAIVRLWEDPKSAGKLAENAKVASDRYTPEAFFRRVFALVDQCVAERTMPAVNKGQRAEVSF
jgi:glycosyltransferase involved in cell wall biosynthesis